MELKHLSLLFLSMTMLVTSTMAQKTYDSEVTLLEQAEKTTLFSVQVEVDKKFDVEKNACEALLTTLLLKGVDGFNNGRPLSNKEAKYWRNENSLFKSNDNYMIYVTCQLEKEPLVTSSGKIKGVVYVMLNHEIFFRYLERYGVRAK